MLFAARTSACRDALARTDTKLFEIPVRLPQVEELVSRRISCQATPSVVPELSLVYPGDKSGVPLDVAA